ncbi:16S rRNA (uracil(1498)-N(3))-methyltransferase [Terribacillus sp. DMT04]|uniref:16S rRNA (uracil(1498)-N(3))-methyltransferase n=1 Tax=Terribacillus sp. DMT04 TaxID=2850441 RepID=UPI001C2C1757|nr:16S rRNA (uracil(1498)-N(3))-methyltransferase [Terribacillus sp. DMT04]QXE00473.1 16S rRNA (uracil(1498)-N(3))-methyltransferase [Terribacillus sp. DMT04]
MQRYFVETANWQDDQITLDGQDAHHIIRVMRMNEGDQIICVHPDGHAAKCTIDAFTADSVLVSETESLDLNTEMPVSVTIAQGLPKGDKLELIVQKGTELGAAGFVPFQAARSVVKWDEKKKDKKRQRLEKIAKEAAEQSSRQTIPLIEDVLSFQALLQSSDTYKHKLFAYEEAAKGLKADPLRVVFESISPEDNVLVVVGPEGGFSETEADSLQQNGFLPVRLGPRILRTETAPMYMLASLSYHFEE